MNRLSGFWNDLKNVIASMTPVDGLDILMLSIIIYALMKWVKETRAEQLVKGIAVLGAAYGIAAIL